MVCRIRKVEALKMKVLKISDICLDNDDCGDNDLFSPLLYTRYIHVSFILQSFKVFFSCFMYEETEIQKV